MYKLQKYYKKLKIIFKIRYCPRKYLPFVQRLNGAVVITITSGCPPNNAKTRPPIV